MASVALVSVLGPDRVGLVAAIAEHLFDVGVNLRDTTFAALGSGAEFVALCELPADLTAADIEAGLKLLPELDGAEIRAVPYAFRAPVLREISPTASPSAAAISSASWPASRRSSSNTRPISCASRRASSRIAREAFM
jgi:predicted amino acid-binding ACT domain protein